MAAKWLALVACKCLPVKPAVARVVEPGWPNYHFGLDHQLGLILA